MSTKLAIVCTAAASSSFVLGYLLGRIQGSKRYADDYIQKPGRECKKTEGLKTFLEYVANHSSPEHPSVTELREVVSEKLQVYKQRATPTDQTTFITQLATAIGAKKVLEVGTFVGTTALSIALVLPEDGEMVTIDVYDDWINVGKPVWAKAGVSHKIRPIVKDAAQALDEMIANGEAETFDMAYLDADKWNNPVYYEKCMELVRKGGLILLDDVLWEGYVFDPKRNKDGRTWEEEPLVYVQESSADEKVTVHVHAVNKKIVKDSRVIVNILPIGNGLSIVTKL